MLNIHRLPKRAAVLPATVILLAATTAACAGDEESSGDGSAYTVMVISNDDSGPQLPQGFPQVANGARAAAAAINDAGGVNGRRIVIDHCETGGDPNTAVQCALRAVRENIPAVVGSLDVIGNHVTVLEEAGIPSIAPWSSNEKWLSNKSAYPITGGGMLSAAGQSSALSSRGAKTIGAVYSSISAAPAKTVLDPIREARPDLTIEQVVIPQNTVDYSAPVAAASRYDGVAVSALENDTIAFLKVLYQGGDEDINVSTFPLSPKALKELGTIADGVISTSAFYPPSSTDIPAIQEYVDYMKKIDPDGSIDEFSANSYAAVQIFAQAAEGLDAVNPSALRERLDTADSFDPKLQGPVSFTTPPTTGPGFDRFFNQNVVLLRVQDGVYVREGDFFNAYTGEPVA